MNREDLKVQLKKIDTLSERKLDCPDDYDLASYLEGGLSEREHHHFELHLADCDFCMGLVGLLGRARDSEANEQIPELLMARSRKLANSKTGMPAFRLRHGRRWATAAAVVLAFGLFINLESSRQFNPGTGSPGASPDPVRQERSIDPYALVPRVTSPLDNSKIDPTSQQFSWAPVRDSLYYQVRIVSDEGDLLWQERLPGTQWKLPSELTLSSNAEYFVRVDAYLTESKSLNSDYVVFRVRETH